MPSPGPGDLTLRTARALQDHARGRQRDRRGGGRDDVTLHTAEAPTGLDEADVLALEEALERLARYGAQKTRIVELRSFAGLSIDEVARSTITPSSSPRTRPCTCPAPARARSR